MATRGLEAVPCKGRGRTRGPGPQPRVLLSPSPRRSAVRADTPSGFPGLLSWLLAGGSGPGQGAVGFCGSVS